MEKVEKPTAVRVKNSFSIENILSRPDKSESQRRLVRQNPFQNNSILFYENPHPDNFVELSSASGENVSRKIRNPEPLMDKSDNEDRDTISECASDDGNSSVHSE